MFVSKYCSENLKYNVTGAGKQANDKGLNYNKLPEL